MSRVSAWYISSASGAEGPFATDLVRAMVRDQRLRPGDLVFREGADEWRPASMCPELQVDVDTGMVEAFRAVENIPDISKTDPSYSIDDGGHFSSNDQHAWIVLRPHGGTYLQEGPYSSHYIHDGLKKSKFSYGQYAWHAGMTQWTRIGDIKEFDRRSTPRAPTPHVPPPLPDPVSVVVLENDDDLESEEFHVSVSPLLRTDLTPVDFFDLKTKKKTETAKNLAQVPWESTFASQEAEVPAELLDDEMSMIDFGQGTQSSRIEDSINDDEGDSRFFDPNEGVTVQPVPNSPVPLISSQPSASVFSRRPDGWQKYGRYFGAMGLSFVAGTFVLHLVVGPFGKGAAEASKQSADRISLAQQAEPLIDGIDVKSTTNPREDYIEASGARHENSPGLPSPITENLSIGKSMSVEITGANLTEPSKASLSFRSVDPTLSSFRVRFHGRAGEILEKLSLQETVKIEKKDSEFPMLSLKELKLPEGSYTVEALTDGMNAQLGQADIFLGRRDADFLNRLETFLRENSYEFQSQKKILFYTAQDLDILARDLAFNYGQRRSKAADWQSFYKKWLTRLHASERPLLELSQRPAAEQAYPGEVDELLKMLVQLKDAGSQYQSGVGSGREIASDELAGLISEMARQKTQIGSLSVRSEKEESKNQ